MYESFMSKAQSEFFKSFASLTKNQTEEPRSQNSDSIVLKRSAQTNLSRNNIKRNTVNFMAE